jgi:hypothetical protein
MTPDSFHAAGVLAMADRIRSIREHGKQILVVDLANCPPSEVACVARTVPDHVSDQPRGSVLLLVNFTGASFDAEAVRAIKESAVFDKPYIHKTAWIGGNNIRKEFHAEVEVYSRRELPVFSTVPEAINWLVKD